jgi:hypothetical protein
MGADFITVDRAKVHGNRAAEIADKLVQLRAMIASEYGAAGHMTDATNYSMLETHFGLNQGDGSDFFIMLGQLSDVLVGTTEIAGATRKAILDGFTGRIGGQ